MSFPTYPSYKNSGVEWLGRVPIHWEIAPLKRLIEIQNGADYKHVEQDDGYPVFGSGGPFTFASDYLFDGESVLLGRKGTIDKPLHVTGRFWTVDTMYWSKIRPTANGRFAYYTATTIPFGYYSTNTALPSMTQTALNGHLIALPPFTEQVAIAALLDRETAKIDVLIEEQRRLIALLKEKRQAVISHAVTKGLDPNAPMKNSGIEWLGEVPEHWEVAPLKRFIQIATSGPRGWSDLLGSEGGIFFQSQNIGTDMRIVLDGAARIAPPAGPDADRSSLQPGDVVVCITGGRTGAIAFVDALPDEAFVNQHVCLVRPRPQDASGHFVSFVLFSEVGQKQLALAMYGLKQGLSLGDIRDLIVPLPPVTEQNKIAKLLASQFDEFAALEAEALKAIALLSERRAALISAAVTGKIDVRESAKVLPFPIDRARVRGLVATEIIERCASQPTFGRVKFQKIAFLAEGHVGISELAGSYLREAAGPLDWALIEEMENGARSIAGVERDQPGGPGTTVSYRLGQSRGEHSQELADWLGEERSAKLDKLIADFADLTTKGAEAVATLYGVWNDALIDGQSPSDDEIIAGFLNDWHSEKPKKFRAAELPTWLDWMRRHGIVPTGTSPKTTTGRLFA